MAEFIQNNDAVTPVDEISTSDPDRLVSQESLKVAVDGCMQEVMAGGSPLEQASAMLAIADDAEAHSLALPGFEDVPASTHAIANSTVYMLRTHAAETDPDYHASRHLLADAESLARKPIEQNTRWMQLTRAYIGRGDGTEGKVEYLSTPSESAVVPMTSDGKVILAQRQAYVTGEDVLTVLTRAAIDNLNPDLVALQALHKLDIPGSQDVLPTRTGTTRPWKYLDAETDHYAIDLPMTAEQLLSSSSVRDPRIKEIVALTEDEFYRAIDAGTISNLGAIDAVQLAIAERAGTFEVHDQDLENTMQYILENLHQPADEAYYQGFEGDIKTLETHTKVLRLLTQDVGITRRELVENETISWFPRSDVDGVPVLPSDDSQAQALGVVYENDEPQSFVMLVEPFLAQGKRQLSLASGSVKNDDGAYTAISEMKEETGYDAVDPKLLVPAAHLMPLYMNARSEVWQVRVTGAGDKVGGDELDFEQGEGVVIPIDHIGWYIKNGYVTDASTLAGLFAYHRKAA